MFNTKYLYFIYWVEIGIRPIFIFLVQSTSDKDSIAFNREPMRLFSIELHVSAVPYSKKVFWAIGSRFFLSERVFKTDISANFALIEIERKN